MVECAHGVRAAPVRFWAPRPLHLMKLEKIAAVLRNGGTAVLPTDTIYGIHASALDTDAVDRVYKIRGRSPDKPFIILISSIEQLELFDIKITNKTKAFLKEKWPARLSVILPCRNDKFQYLHRGTQSLAFRVPDRQDLRELVDMTGPLISTSVNPEGESPAEFIEQAEKYFGDKIDKYVDGGKLSSPPSTVIKISDEEIEILREGSVKIDQAAL